MSLFDKFKAAFFTETMKVSKTITARPNFNNVLICIVLFFVTKKSTINNITKKRAILDFSNVIVNTKNKRQMVRLSRGSC